MYHFFFPISKKIHSNLAILILSRLRQDGGFRSVVSYVRVRPTKYKSLRIKIAYLNKQFHHYLTSILS